MDAQRRHRLFNRIDAARDVRAALTALVVPDERPWVWDAFPAVEREIVDAVCQHFPVTPHDVQIVGSGRFGGSLLTLSPFVPGCSDLDVAVVSAASFETRAAAWTPSCPSSAQPYLAAGMIRPDLFAQAPWSAPWTAWTDAMSQTHRRTFREITVTLYRSLEDLRVKQQYALYRLGMARALAAIGGDRRSDGVPAGTDRGDPSRLLSTVEALVASTPEQLGIVSACMQPHASRVTCRYAPSLETMPGQLFQSMRAVRDAFDARGLAVQWIPDNARSWSRLSRASRAEPSCRSFLLSYTHSHRSPAETSPDPRHHSRQSIREQP